MKPEQIKMKPEQIKMKPEQIKMKPEQIKIIEEWFEVKVETFIKEFENYYKENANLEKHIQTLNSLNIELENTLEFEDENKNKISNEELAYLKEQDLRLPKLGGMLTLLGFGQQDYWLCPTLPYRINNKTLYKTQENLELFYKIERLKPLIEISKLTIEEYVEKQLKIKLSSCKTYETEMNKLYQKITYYINNLVDGDYYDCYDYYDDEDKYEKYKNDRNQKIKEELNKSSIIEEIQNIYNIGLLNIDQKWSKYGYNVIRRNIDDIVSEYLNDL